MDSASTSARTRHTPDEAARASILRALTVWTGDAVAAEDLTQQTLLAAWTSERQPEADDEWTPWLFGVARNMLLRWRRDQARHGRRVAPAPESDRHLMVAASEDVVDALVDRGDVVEILDGALARIPGESRRALLLRYVEDLPQREIAARLGIGEKALEGKLHRGKRAMNRILLTERADMAVAMGLLSDRNAWTETDVWCPECGRRRFVARWTDDGDLWVDCTDCEAAPMNGARNTAIRTFEAGQGIRNRFGDPRATSFGTAIRSVFASVYDASPEGFDTIGTCMRCGGQVRTSIADYYGDMDHLPPDLKMQCVRCGFIECWGWSAAGCGSHPLVLDWMDREHRVRMTTREFMTTIDNRPATLQRFESLTSNSTITAWRDLGTMKFVLIERDGIALNPKTDR